ncbi:MAG: phosphoenolpyruvate--protein phosphotransferase [Candidatus Omnitrophota bacterium]
MRRVKGIPVSPGFTIGKALVYHSEDLFSVPFRAVEPDELSNEIARFEDAITRTRAEIIGIRKKLAIQMGREHSEIFNAHLLILEDRTLIEDVIAEVKKRRVTADYAFSLVVRRYVEAFSKVDDEYLKERVSDIKDVSKRILQNLVGGDREKLDRLDEDIVLIAHDLSPSDTASMDKQRVLGFVTEIGGPTSHTAILGRSFEIPAVVGLEGITRMVRTGDLVIVDGTHGVVIVDPDEKVIEEYTQQERRFTELISELDKLRNLPAETKDGRKITLAANIEFHDEIPSVISHGAEGIGLYRTEYFYMNRSDLPAEEEQYQAYRQVAEKMAPNPVIIRTLDLGGDKFLSSLEIPHEMNPYLGWRAIRFCLARTDIFKAQLRAILRASAHGNIKIMYPMISNVEELRKANGIVDECRAELTKEGVSFDPFLEVGAMIEIPSAALTSDILAQEVQFFSIGTNDLIQYALAVDRGNEKIAYLYDPVHPAILKLIKMVVDNGHQAGRWVGCCGEMSAHPVTALLLLGLGIDEISTSPIILPRVKQTIRAFSYEESKSVALEAMKFHTGQEVEAFVTSKIREISDQLLEDL